MLNPNILVIGISGVTCGGKTTTAIEMNKILPDSKSFSQDDYYLSVEDPRHTWIPELDHINFDILSSLDMDKMTDDIRKYINEYKSGKKMPNITGNRTEYQNGDFLNTSLHSELREKCYKEVTARNVHLVIVEGFCIFNHSPLADLIDLKYYFTLDRETCFQRRTQRVYEPPDCPGYFELYAWPEHVKQLQEVRETVENMTYFDDSIKSPVDHIIKDILELLESTKI